MTGKWQWRVLIVVNQPIFRATVHHVLAADARFMVVAEAGSGEEAVAIVQQVALDLILIDLRLPGMNGLAAAATIKAGCPQLIILILSGDWSPRYERQAKAVGVRARLAKQNLCLDQIYRVLG